MSETKLHSTDHVKSAWAYNVKMYGLPLDELCDRDIAAIESMLLVQGNEILVLSTLGYPGCVMYIESPYDNPLRGIEDLEPCWKVFSEDFQRLILHCQLHDFSWLRLSP